jgi:hypothetical protein
LYENKSGASIMANRQSLQHDAVPPATLHGVIQAALARDLRELYPVSEKIPHQMLVLLLQMNENNKKKGA